MKLKFKKLADNVKIPVRMHDTDACYDIFSPTTITLPAGKITKFSLDFSVQTPYGFKLCLFSRSGLGSKGIMLTNSVGIVDPGYRGAVGVAFFNTTDTDYVITEGDRILQMSLEQIYSFEIEETTELNETDRGDCGFGGTGK